MANSGKQPEQTDTAAEKPKKRTVTSRLARARNSSSLKEGERLLDLVMYRNATKVRQVVTTDDNVRIVLEAPGFTDRSQVDHEKDHSKPLKRFPGGTVILTRKRGIPLVATGVLAEVSVVDYATDEDEE